MNIEIGKRASHQVERASDRWQKYRPSAPFLVEQELDEALRRLRTMPKIGIPYAMSKRSEVRRLLLPKTEYHLYYTLERDETVIVIHSVWGARRGRGPKL